MPQKEYRVFGPGPGRILGPLLDFGVELTKWEAPQSNHFKAGFTSAQDADEYAMFKNLMINNVRPDFEKRIMTEPLLYAAFCLGRQLEYEKLHPKDQDFFIRQVSSYRKMQGQW